METWKDIPGYEGLYQASTLGNIRSVEGKITRSARFNKRCWKSRVLKWRGNQPSGGRVNLWKDGEKREYLVHRLVALTFLGVPEKNMTVNHINGDRFDNRIENLEWLTLEENIRYGFSHGQYPTKHIQIKCGEETFFFPSYSECDRFLGRATGYTSGCVLKGTAIISKGGVRYQRIK